MENPNFETTLIGAVLIGGGFLIIATVFMQQLNPEIIGEELLRNSIMQLAKIVIIGIGFVTAIIGCTWWYTTLKINELNNKIDAMKKEN